MEESFFKDKESEEAIMNHFAENCFKKNECEFSSDILDLNDLISRKCQYRINEQHGIDGAPTHTDKLTSNQFLMVIGCRKDFMQMPFTETFLHKEEVGVFVVFFDIIGIITMILVFNKIKEANNEYIQIIDRHQMTMKDFTVQCQNVICDRHT